jgi:hypothetical protein
VNTDSAEYRGGETAGKGLEIAMAVAGGVQAGKAVIGGVGNLIRGAEAASTVAEGASEGQTAFRAIDPKFPLPEEGGSFFRSGSPGRLGNDGIYANTTREGAVAEFQYHNPGVEPAVFEVNVPKGSTLNIERPPTGYSNSPLPFTQDANVLTAPSVRAPGTTNLLIRDGATVGGRVQ